MAVDSQLEEPVPEAGDNAFLEHAHLTYIIPSATDVDIKAEVEQAVAQSSPLEDVDTRSWLFFGTLLCLMDSPKPRPTVLIHRCQMKPSTSF